ncbi:OB-fold putative lipoprotein [Winogradskyella sp. MH6]|uniref:OB-fold putative lipoprotein n=1 Tax=Winogradskyella sp. MH6 TaxID=2929510 RepID=UPI001FB2800D|nr:OB-fold putative lipoprotein [Winogradskyella sp. MH6]
MKRNWIALIIVLIITTVIGYNYVYQDHRDIESEQTEFTMSSVEINQLFSKNPTSAEQKFLNKTIEVSGLITDINSNDITIDDTVFCQFSNNLEPSLNKNEKVKIKGRVIGYDDLLEQVKLDQCSINK